MNLFLLFTILQDDCEKSMNYFRKNFLYRSICLSLHIRIQECKR